MAKVVTKYVINLLPIGRTPPFPNLTDPLGGIIRRTELLRQVLVQFLNRREADRIDQEMAEYVDELAPQSGEFVKESERHTLSRLLKETKW